MNVYVMKVRMVTQSKMEFYEIFQDKRDAEREKEKMLHDTVHWRLLEEVEIEEYTIVESTYGDERNK